MSDVGIKINDLTYREGAALRAIADLARTIVPVLRDHNAVHLATELDRRIFEWDAVKQEMSEFMRQNIDAVLDLMMKGPRP